jgi:tRNA(adenine34) deaminase
LCRLNHRITVNTGILGEECGGLLSDFFREMRLHKDALKRNK